MNRMIAASCVLLMVAPTARAQPPRPVEEVQFRIRPHPRFLILFRHPAVQDELKLTAAQKAQLQKIEDELRREATRRVEAARKLADRRDDPEEQAATIQQGRGSGVLFGSDVEPAILKVLDRAQRTRLDQIRLQACGPAAFLLPEVQERLNLDPGQVERLQALADEARGEEAKLTKPSPAAKAVYEAAARRGAPGANDLKLEPNERETLQAEREKSREDTARMRQAIDQKIARVLTRRQREAYRKMLGEPFIVNGQIVRKPLAPAPEVEAKPR